MKVNIVNCFDTYQMRVESLYDYYSSRGYEVVIIQSTYKHIQKKYNLVKKLNYQYVDVKSYTKNLSISRMLSHKQFAQDAFKLVRKNNPELVHVLVPPNSLVYEAYSYKKYNHCKLIYDVIDMWPETMPIPICKNLFPFAQWKNLRDKYLYVADYILTECKLFQSKLNNGLNNKMKTIYFSTRNMEFEDNCIKSNKVIFAYLGSINHIIDIDMIIRILKNQKKYTEVELKIIGDGERKKELLEKCTKENIEFIDYGKVFDLNRKREILQTCNFGLNIYKKTTFIGLTMKNIDYFNAGLPIINTLKGDTFDFIRENKCGYNVDTRNDKIEYFSYMRTNAKKVYDDHFSINSFYKDMDLMIEEIMKE